MLCWFEIVPSVLVDLLPYRRYCYCVGLWLVVRVGEVLFGPEGREDDQTLEMSSVLKCQTDRVPLNRLLNLTHEEKHEKGSALVPETYLVALVPADL